MDKESLCLHPHLNNVQIKSGNKTKLLSSRKAIIRNTKCYPRVYTQWCYITIKKLFYADCKNLFEKHRVAL